MEECYTDVTEFAIQQALKNSITSIRWFNSEIVAYNLSTSPNLEQVKAMLDQAFTESRTQNTILP